MRDCATSQGQDVAGWIAQVEMLLAAATPLMTRRQAST